MSRRRPPRVRPFLLWLGAALVLGWIGALVSAWTIDPRRGVVTETERWVDGAYTVTRRWEAPFSTYFESVYQHGYKRPWGTEQVTGAPDTHGLGDIETAWASATPDGQPEWLMLRWAHPVEATQILIYQTFNPGAVTRITVPGDAGAEEPIWDAARDAQGLNLGSPTLVLPLRTPVRVDRLTIHLDSQRVPGWNEIDSVGVRCVDGVLHYAADAEASSNYAARNSLGTGRVDRLPGWTGMNRAGGRAQPAHRAFERRGAGAFGWPMRAWAAYGSLETGAQPSTPLPGARTAGFATGAGPLRAVPYRPLLPGVIINTLCILGALALLRLIFFAPLRPIHRVLRMQRGRCPACGYDLRYNFAGGCSECGFLRSWGSPGSKQ